MPRWLARSSACAELKCPCRRCSTSARTAARPMTSTVRPIVQRCISVVLIDAWCVCEPLRAAAKPVLRTLYSHTQVSELDMFVSWRHSADSVMVLLAAGERLGLAPIQKHTHVVRQGQYHQVSGATAVRPGVKCDLNNCGCTGSSTAPRPARSIRTRVFRFDNGLCCFSADSSIDCTYRSRR